VYRLICKEAEKSLGQPIVPLNKPGGSFSIAIAAIASSTPDGYTIGYAGHPGMFVVPLTEKVPYHPVKDLKQIMQFGFLNIAVTVKGDSPFKKFEDIVTYARQNPKKLTYGSAGEGSFGHLGMELIAKREKVQFTHIPFKGSPETQVALLGGHILVGTGEFDLHQIILEGPGGNYVGAGDLARVDGFAETAKIADGDVSLRIRPQYYLSGHPSSRLNIFMFSGIHSEIGFLDFYINEI
jgi:hypothetical protein